MCSDHWNLKHFVSDLEHIIYDGTVLPSPAKLAAVQEYKAPTGVKSLQRFLGLANYYRRRIKDLSTLAEPLTRLARSDAKFLWSSQQQQAFDAIKVALTTAPVIAIFRSDRAVFLYTDASTVGIGAILTQPVDDGQKRVVAYH